MNKKIKDHLINYCVKNDWEFDNDGLIELLIGSTVIYRENLGSHRWYDDVFIVVAIDGMPIGFDFFHVTGDTHWTDMGLEFDLDSVCEVEKHEQVITIYKKK